LAGQQGRCGSTGDFASQRQQQMQVSIWRLDSDHHAGADHQPFQPKPGPDEIIGHPAVRDRPVIVDDGVGSRVVRAYYRIA